MLDVVTATLLGGVNIFGGEGTIAGVVLAVFVIGALRNGLTLMGVSSVYQVLVTGILVILAVSVDQLSRKSVR